MPRSLILLVIAWLARAQANLPQPSPTSAPPTSAVPAPPTEASIRARMEASLAKQRESVRKQAASAVEVPAAAAASWFTVPWEPATLGDAPQASSDCPAMAEPEIEALVGKNAESQKLSKTLLREVIRQESAFRPCAVSVKGAMGLMQLMPETAAGFGVVDAFDPEANVSAGARFLAALLERYKGDERLALAAYNAGADRVSQYRGVPPFPETENYIKAILGRVEALKPSATEASAGAVPPPGASGDPPAGGK